MIVSQAPSSVLSIYYLIRTSQQPVVQVLFIPLFYRRIWVVICPGWGCWEVMEPEFTTMLEDARVTPPPSMTPYCLPHITPACPQAVTGRWNWQTPKEVREFHWNEPDKEGVLSLITSMNPPCMSWSPCSYRMKSPLAPMHHESNFSLSHQGAIAELTCLFSCCLPLESSPSGWKSLKAKIPGCTQVRKQICRVELKYLGSF